MTILGLMILVTVATMLLSGMADGRRRQRRGGPRPLQQSQFQSFQIDGGSWQQQSIRTGWQQQTTGWQQETFATGAAPYGFTQRAWGLPTDVPLSDASRAAIDSDITQFGIELQELDFDVVGYELTDDARGDYGRALDAYENAKQALVGARADSDATHITHILEEGRHAMACVRARALGKPLPARRPPCFFDPAHGPSVEDVAWAPAGGAERQVPACAVDAARISLGSDPRIRMVNTGQAAVPYWEDRNHAAWARGYYGSWMHDPSMRRMTQGAMMIGGFSLLMGMLDD